MASNTKFCANCAHPNKYSLTVPIVCEKCGAKFAFAIFSTNHILPTPTLKSRLIEEYQEDISQDFSDLNIQITVQQEQLVKPITLEQAINNPIQKINLPNTTPNTILSREEILAQFAKAGESRTDIKTLSPSDLD